VSVLRRQAQIAPPAMAALAALGLLWVVRHTPLSIAPAIAIDALGAFFALATFGGLTLATAARAPGTLHTPWRTYVAALALAAGYLTDLTPVIAAAYLPLALLDLAGLSRRGRHPLRSALGPLALLSLAVGYGALATRGALRYDDRAAGAALDSFVFWFVLLAAAIPLLPLGPETRDRRPETGDPRPETTATTDDRPTTNDQRPACKTLSLAVVRRSLRERQRRSSFVVRRSSYPAPPGTPSAYVVQRSAFSVQRSPFVLVLRFAWLYPLARLYSLGPWNEGWSFAALLLGGGAALWSVAAALTHTGDERRSNLTVPSQLGLALAGFGLSTGAGLAAGCYGVLTYLVLAAAQTTTDHRPPTTDRTPDAPTQPSTNHIVDAPAQSAIVPWFLTPALPFSAPFVAAWMLLGAGVSGGVALLGAVAWLVALLGAAATLLGERRGDSPRAMVVAAGASAALGLLAPVVVLALIQPVIEQLQGGLSVHGDINIWPWVGLAAVDSTRRGVTALPSIAVAALMLVLSALVYLAGRLRADLAPSGDDAPPEAPRPQALLSALREQVPWLGAPPRTEERAGDDR
jgi:hypothetical protein